MVSFENGHQQQLEESHRLFVSLASENVTGTENDIRLELVEYSPSPSRVGRRRASLVPELATGPRSDREDTARRTRRAHKRRRKANRRRLAGRTRRRKESREGKVAYTGLALIEPDHPLYKEMPLKFASAIVWSSSGRGENGGGGEAGRQVAGAGAAAAEGEQPQVYVNFMSENRFERRQAYSGPVDKVYWFPSYSRGAG